MSAKWKPLQPAYVPTKMVDNDATVLLQAEHDGSTIEML